MTVSLVNPEIEEVFKRPDKMTEIFFSISSFFGILMFGIWGNIRFFAELGI